MTDDYRNGLQAGLTTAIDATREKLKQPEMTPDASRWLQMLGEELRLDLEEAAR